MAEAPEAGHRSLVLRTFLDREIRDLLESGENLRALVALVAPDLVTHLDFAASKNVRRAFLGEDLQEAVVDLLVEVPYQDASWGSVLVYLLVEHQSAKAPRMPLRLLGRMAGIFDRQWDARDRMGVPASKIGDTRRDRRRAQA